MAAASAEPVVVEWPRGEFVPLASEQALIPLLLRTRKERGMLSAHPAWRKHKVEAACARLGVSFETALSLRRHHVQLRQRGVPSRILALGTDAQRKAEADAFEAAIAAHLGALGVAAVDEAAQRANGAAGAARPTPDFLLPTPIDLRTTAPGAVAAPLRWIEAKHFYGADSVPAHDGKSAVGSVLRTVDTYVAHYGPGAIVFAYGCGEALAAAIEARGALVLDATPLDMRAVRALAAQRH